MQRAVVALFCLMSAGSAYGQTVLQWKLQPGDSFRVESVEKQKQKVTTGGKASELLNTITTVVAVNVQKTTADGVLAEIKLESVKMDAKEAVGVDAELARLMTGASFLVTLTPQGQITSFEGYDVFIKKLTQGRPSSEKLIRSLVTEDGIKKTLADHFSFLPEKSVQKGDVWQRTGLIPLGPMGRFQSVNKYIYEGKRDSFDVIAYTSTLSYELPKNGSDIFKVVKGDLKATSASGSFLFDATRGRLHQAEKRLVLNGAMTIDVAGNQIDMKLEMEQTTTVRALP